jgi:FAD/FMN-containing dehydrogenase
MSRVNDLSELRSDLSGAVIAPDDAGYDEARRVFYAGLDRRPAAIVRVTNGSDVATAIRFARATGLDFTVRSGGHSVAGHSIVDGGIVIDVRGLDHVEIDAARATAWAGSGLTAAELCAATAEHGLAVGFGDSGSVGIGGITLGGGVGFLARKYGLTVDSVLAVELVTVDGELIVADDSNHPDLFWALRGGGGNFGVVTRFQYALHPVDRVLGGMMALPATPEVIAGFVAESAAAPDELSAIGNVMSAPPMPFLPDELVGQTVLLAIMVWCGDLEEGRAVIDRFRALATPLADFVDEIGYPEIYPPEDDSYQPLAVALTGFTETFDDDKIATTIAAIAASDAPMRAVQLRVLGGQVARVPADATAYAHRHREIMINVASFYEDESERPRREEWVADLHRLLTDGDQTGYVGFLADEGPERVRAAYPGATWDRLREVKAKYDPENLLHHNQNIPPAS